MLRTLSNIDIRHEIVFKSAIDMSICTVSMDAADRFKVVNRWAPGGSHWDHPSLKFVKFTRVAKRQTAAGFDSP